MCPLTRNEHDSVLGPWQLYPESFDFCPWLVFHAARSFRGSLGILEGARNPTSWDVEEGLNAGTSPKRKRGMPAETP